MISLATKGIIVGVRIIIFVGLAKGKLQKKVNMKGKLQEKVSIKGIFQ